MADVSRPVRSRYTWSDDDDTEVPTSDVPPASSSARPDAAVADEGATEADLNDEVRALEADERRAAPPAPSSGPSLDRRWDTDDSSDLAAVNLRDDEVAPIRAHLERKRGEDRAATDAQEPDPVADTEDPVIDAGGPVALVAPADTDARPIAEERRAAVLAQALAADGGRPRGPDPATVTAKQYSDVVYVFEPNTKQLPPIREYLSELWARRRFMVELARSESRGSRSATVLGELWAVIDPLFQVALYWFLLSIIRGGRGGADGQNLSQRLVMMVGGIFLFSLSSTTITAGGRSILSGKNLMLNSTFPRALLPLSAAYKAVVEFIPTIFIYLVFHVAFGQPFGVGFFVLPLLFVIQMVMGIGLGLLFATFTVFLRDTTNILGYIMRVLFFATPVIYPASAIPDTLHMILLINPLLGLFTAYQDIIAGGTPNPIDVAAAAAWATLFIVTGYRLFVSNERSFALRL